MHELHIPVNAVSGGRRIDPLKQTETVKGTHTHTHDTGWDLLIDRWPLNDQLKGKNKKEGHGVNHNGNIIIHGISATRPAVAVTSEISFRYIKVHLDQ